MIHAVKDENNLKSRILYEVHANYTIMRLVWIVIPSVVVLIYWNIMYVITTLFYHDSTLWPIYKYGYLPLAWASHNIFNFIHPVTGLQFSHVSFCSLMCGVSKGDFIGFAYSGYFEAFFISAVIFGLVASIQKIIKIVKS